MQKGQGAHNADHVEQNVAAEPCVSQQEQEELVTSKHEVVGAGQGGGGGWETRSFD